MNFADEIERIPLGSFVKVASLQSTMWTMGELIRKGEGVIVLKNLYGMETIISLFDAKGFALSIMAEEEIEAEKAAAKLDMQYTKTLEVAIKQIPIGTPIEAGEDTGVIVERGLNYFVIKELDDSLVIKSLHEMSNVELVSKETWEETKKQYELNKIAAKHATQQVERDLAIKTRDRRPGES